MTTERIFTQSGRALDELTIEALLLGELSADDFRISTKTLDHQANKAEAAGYRQLAMNLRRAAELTNFGNQEIIDIYNKLRPGRASYEQLVELAEHLELECEAPMVASLIREAAEVYQVCLLK